MNPGQPMTMGMGMPLGGVNPNYPLQQPHMMNMNMNMNMGMNMGMKVHNGGMNSINTIGQPGTNIQTGAEWRTQFTREHRASLISKMYAFF
jgi:hypothetical protein